MNENKNDEAADLQRGPAASPRWTGAPAIELAHQLNRQCVDLACELAASPHTTLPAFILQNRDLWRLLELEARQRVAAFPFVIVDARFQDAAWWRDILSKLAINPADLTLSSRSDPKLFEDLMLETLLFARQAAREDIVVATALFAMTSPVASLIASLSLQQVRAIALSHTEQLRVRWDETPEFWGDLLIACRADDEVALAAIRRRGKRLFCGELAPSPPSARPNYGQ
jgi:hypothetical protein